VFALRDMAARIAVLATAGTAGWVVARGLAPNVAVLAAGGLLGAMGIVGFFVRAAGEAGDGSGGAAL
jgi:hypothetical protein